MTSYSNSPPTVDSVPDKTSAALPGFNRLAGLACAVGLLPVVLLLLSGRTRLAESAALGVAISLGICGLLFLFVERVMPVLTGTSRKNIGSAQSSKFQFLLLLGVKLLFIALVGAAVLTLRHISSIAVLAGFLVGQTTMIVSAFRFRQPN